ncbi:uncharacterized protein J4E78_003639 [Alternaria triticimaculans]|uniref:uncharacterized protein n=1 Tax=Alternaria triticimaculans TaxID=297637 RepID=UPI0020C51722|nr:uncharacterized protein J4E78_003639 [Alternaria triticimaculans]KAI4663228.1 hypothetical protein J4E78_003639 [Alternaria triticimaculans]
MADPSALQVALTQQADSEMTAASNNPSDAASRDIPRNRPTGADTVNPTFPGDDPSGTGSTSAHDDFAFRKREAVTTAWEQWTRTSKPIDDKLKDWNDTITDSQFVDSVIAELERASSSTAAKLIGVLKAENDLLKSSNKTLTTLAKHVGEDLAGQTTSSAGVYQAPGLQYPMRPQTLLRWFKRFADAGWAVPAGLSMTKDRFVDERYGCPEDWHGTNTVCICDDNSGLIIHKGFRDFLDQQRGCVHEAPYALAMWLYLSRYNIFWPKQTVSSWFFEQASRIDSRHQLDFAAMDDDQHMKAWLKATAAELPSIWDQVLQRQEEDDRTISNKLWAPVAKFVKDHEHDMLEPLCDVYNQLGDDEFDLNEAEPRMTQTAHDVFLLRLAQGEAPATFLSNDQEMHSFNHLRVAALKEVPTGPDRYTRALGKMMTFDLRVQWMKHKPSPESSQSSINILDGANADEPMVIDDD